MKINEIIKMAIKDGNHKKEKLSMAVFGTEWHINRIISGEFEVHEVDVERLRPYLGKDFDSEESVKDYIYHEKLVQNFDHGDLRRIRLSNGWFIKEMAQITGIPGWRVNAIEHGRCRIKWLDLKALSMVTETPVHILAKCEPQVITKQATDGVAFWRWEKQADGRYGDVKVVLK